MSLSIDWVTSPVVDASIFYCPAAEDCAENVMGCDSLRHLTGRFGQTPVLPFESVAVFKRGVLRFLLDGSFILLRPGVVAFLGFPCHLPRLG
jgi:hypothetical protein